MERPHTQKILEEAVVRTFRKDLDKFAENLPEDPDPATTNAFLGTLRRGSTVRAGDGVIVFKLSESTNLDVLFADHGVESEQELQQVLEIRSWEDYDKWLVANEFGMWINEFGQAMLTSDIVHIPGEVCVLSAPGWEGVELEEVFDDFDQTC